MTGTAEFTTERLRMRRYRTDDAPLLYEGFGRDPQMTAYSDWNPYATREMAEETVRRFIGSYDDPGFYGWAVEHQGQLIGTVGAYDYDAERNQIEIGISIARAFWGKGFATEALSGVLRYLTAHEGIGTVTAWCAAENTGSMKAMTKAGMKQTAVVKGGLDVDGKTYDKLVFRYPADHAEQRGIHSCSVHETGE